MVVAIPEDDYRSLLARDQFEYELAQIGRLNPLEERRLADMARAGSKEAGELLIESCLTYARCYALVYVQRNPHIDVLDLIQAGSEAMVRRLPEALKARNACAFLRVVARYTILDYSIEDRLIRVPSASYRRGRRAPLVISLSQSICNDLTVLDGCREEVR